MSIKLLPASDVSKIKSSVVLTSLNGVLVGLVQNSLDADATKIIVSVDYGRGNCSVQDDGLGIPPQEFEVNGGLGKLHFTSKYPASDAQHGRHGAFLASVGALSLLSIASHHRDFCSHNSMTVHNGRVMARDVPARPEQRVLTFPTGTRVTVRDLFGSMPVRVKQRAAEAARGASARDFDQLVRHVVALLVAWHGPVAVSLRDASKVMALRTECHKSRTGVATRTSSLLAQASLFDGSGSDQWVHVEASGSGLLLQGCVCLVPAATKQLQFLALGVRPVLNEAQCNPFYEAINRVFANSSFGATDETANGPARKGVDRWPMFFMQINANTAGTWLDAEEQGPSLAAMIDLIKATSFEFLKKHHFSPRRTRAAQERTTPSPGKPGITPGSASQRAKALLSGPGSRPASPSRMWSNMASGHARKIARGSDCNDISTTARASKPSMFDASGKLLRTPFVISDDEPFLRPSTRDDMPGAVPSPPRETAVWVDPVTKIRSVVDARTGFAIKEAPQRLSLRHTSSSDRPRPPTSGWLKKALDTWENPVFERAEMPIPRVREFDEPGPGEHTCHGPHAVALASQGAISRRALQKARVVAQVDRKFILARISRVSGDGHEIGDSPNLLILIDQHAADERHRVEELMRGYFGSADGHLQKAVTERLEKPLRFELPQRDGTLLERYRDHFAHWGIIYSLVPTVRQGKPLPTGVEVVSLPPSILERCRLEPRLLVELLRKEIYKLDDGTVMAHAGHAAAQWVARFHGCPQGILDLINSRACRSAIMFNDVLSLAECEAILQRLTTCAFPFQCAHGRPSMVPLLDLGRDDILDQLKAK